MLKYFGAPKNILRYKIKEPIFLMNCSPLTYPTWWIALCRSICNNIFEFWEFLIYFGVNTIWYLQFQLVCDKLFMSFILNGLPLLFWLQLPDRFSYFTQRELFCHLLRQQPFLNHSPSEWFSLYKKPADQKSAGLNHISFIVWLMAIETYVQS